MRILLASSNPHKLEEIRAIFAIEAQGDLGWIELIGLESLERPIAPPAETGRSFEANAVLKARVYAAESGLICLADDSGLEVDALGGEPGVDSANYAGLHGPRSTVDPANNQLLLKKLGDTPIERRTARFVCVMALVTPPDLTLPRPRTAAPSHGDDVLALVRGAVEGRILLPHETADPSQPQRGRGEHGFGYDPLFHVPHLEKTLAELLPDQKNALSHRGAAARRIWKHLEQLEAMQG
jgi:XTP/dITP diphosphohydrolase